MRGGGARCSCSAAAAGGETRQPCPTALLFNKILNVKLIVVQSACCCSVVTVNNKNSVQVPTFNSSTQVRIRCYSTHTQHTHGSEHKRYVFIRPNLLLKPCSLCSKMGLCVDFWVTLMPESGVGMSYQRCGSYMY